MLASFIGLLVFVFLIFGVVGTIYFIRSEDKIMFLKSMYLYTIFLLSACGFVISCILFIYVLFTKFLFPYDSVNYSPKFTDISSNYQYDTPETKAKLEQAYDLYDKKAKDFNRRNDLNTTVSQALALLICVAPFLLYYQKLIKKPHDTI